jgi:hypothetical protein
VCRKAGISEAAHENGGLAKRLQRGPATQCDRQQSADIAVEWLIGAPAGMSLNPGKFQLTLA